MTPEELARDAIRVIDRVEDQQLKTLDRLISVIEKDFLELAKALDFTDNEESRAVKQLRIQSALNQSAAQRDLLAIGKANSETEQGLRQNVITAYQDGLDSSQRAVLDTGILTAQQIDAITTFAPRVELEYVNALTRTTLTTLERVAERTLDRLEEELVRTSVRGAGPIAAARSIRDTFDLTRNEAERITRTVFMNANNTARMSQFKDLGLNYLQYTAANDDRVCEYCEARHGMVYKIDNSPEVPTHPNCRCVLLPWSPESKPENRGDAYYESTRREMRERREDEDRPGTTATAQAPFERINGVPAPEPVWAPGRGFLDRDEEVLPATSIERPRLNTDEIDAKMQNIANDPRIVELQQKREETERQKAALNAEKDAISVEQKALTAQVDELAERIKFLENELQPNTQLIEQLTEQRNELLAKEADFWLIVSDMDVRGLDIRDAEESIREKERALRREIGFNVISNESTGHVGVAPKFNAIGLNEKQTNNMKAASSFFAENTVLGEVLPENFMVKQIAADNPEQRAFASLIDKNPSISLSGRDGLNTAIHEIAHLVELDDRYFEASVDWRYSRTAGEPIVKLSDVTGIPYGDHEVTSPDSFFDAYVGKIYKSRYTEVLSMGIEAMFEDPARFYEDDPDHFMFTLRAMKGEL